MRTSFFYCFCRTFSQWAARDYLYPRNHSNSLFNCHIIWVNKLHNTARCRVHSLQPVIGIHNDKTKIMSMNSGFQWVSLLIIFQSGHGLSVKSSLSGYAVLRSYDSDNCIVRPHLCPSGFTLVFYAKIYRSDRVNSPLLQFLWSELLLIFFTPLSRGLPFVCSVWYFPLIIKAKLQLQGLIWPLGCINNTTDNNTWQYSDHVAMNNSIEID